MKPLKGDCYAALILGSCNGPKLSRPIPNLLFFAIILESFPPMYDALVVSTLPARPIPAISSVVLAARAPC